MNVPNEMVTIFTCPLFSKIPVLNLRMIGPKHVPSLERNILRTRRAVSVAVRNIYSLRIGGEGNYQFLNFKPKLGVLETVDSARKTVGRVGMMATSSYTSIPNLTLNKSQGKCSQQVFDYFLVLDFEATCDNGKQPSPQEIIEFPVLKVNAKTCNTESVFHQYVLPQYHPQLTPFCTELTGIVQDMVNDQPHLPEVLQKFHHWMNIENLLDPECQSIFITCGDWDLKTMLPKECTYLDLSPRKYFGRWINIKRAFAEMTGMFPKGMMPMLENLNIKHEGRHHSGIDDCRNIAKILVAMIQQGFVFKQNGFLR